MEQLLQAAPATHMSDTKTTTVRVSRETKARLESVSTLSGLNNFSRTVDFAVEAAEEKLNRYRGNIDSLFKFKAVKSRFKDTSENVDKVLAKVISNNKRLTALKLFSSTLE